MMSKINMLSATNASESNSQEALSMALKQKNIVTKTSGIGRLSSDAVTGVTDIVESVHKTALSLPVFLGGANLSGSTLNATNQLRTKGFTGLVYNNIRAITGFMGDGIDALIDHFSAESEKKCASSSKSPTLAVLNGVLGDHLVKRSNPLAINMCFRRNGVPLDEQALAEVIKNSQGKVAIMLHGSCMNDLQWLRNGHDHGTAIKRDLGFEPIYLYYNTGLHISENGRNFSELLEKLTQLSDQPLDMIMIAHSMGGLVARSACHYSKELNHTWLKQLSKLVFLGTPHHGTHLEKAGNLVDFFLETNPYSAPFSRLGKIRSSGVTDLRYGNVVDDDWNGRDRFELSSDKRVPVPLPENVECYAMAASAGSSSNLLSDGLIGDGLVNVNSAFGCHKKTELSLLFPPEHQWVGRNMGHLSLLDHPDVYETLRRWLSA
jgi:pimeloyl-ACP methyl ester carboxylesterase